MTADDLAGPEPSETDIAIVGMSGRFPGASDVDELWRRAEAGDDCLTDLTAEQLAAAGVPRSVSDDPDYVRRAGVLDHVEGFDAAFFGIGPRDASIMDPQHRHFMELCWEALETSGHVPERFDGAIGVFAGCGFNTYMLHNLLTNAELVDQVGMFLLRHTANDKDFLSTTVSYRLDLRGPSVNVQTACSTSLVAVHLAVQSLLAFECDIALAGGSTIQVPHFAGYMYHEGEILSPDGHCRAFDERSAGTVLTSGAGVVALRRLADALDGDDPILAVIKGSAINNDGQRKVGYLAPSVDGHADVVQEALAVAGLSARDIQLLEAHGTGTSVGDPIEVAALTEAFRASTDETGFCRLGSSKPSIGHLDTAAGVASLIKAVQALRHRTLPPLANHTAPSPLLDLDRTPFVLSATAAPWPGGAPRRAGISSLGVGGTNAHVVIEEAPPGRPVPAAPAEQVLALSAVDTATLDETAHRLADALEADPALDLADVAHTLAAGRRAMPHRRVVTATDTSNAVDVLRGGDRNRVATAVAPDAPARIAFLFPGGGSQYLGMGAGLDDRFAVFHEVMADGIRLVQQRSGLDLAPLLRPDAPPEALRKTTASLPAVFLTSVALARQWMAWGVTPDAYVGHSLGEYTAAHLAGVLSLEGALDLILARATLMDRVSGVGAAMLAVPLPVGEVEPLLTPALSVATINAVDECVIAGPADDLEILAKRVAARDVEPTLIPLDAAAHSSMLDPVLPEFLDTVRGIPLTAPVTPYLSNLTGTWITAEQATDPGYWVDHLRHTVRFADCLRTALADGPLVTLEMGPGHSLSSYARRQEITPIAAIPVLRHPNQAIDDTAYGLLAAGRAWAAGVALDLDRFAGPGRRLVRLPGYPFRRVHHWIEPGSHVLATSAPAATSRAELARPLPDVRRIADVTDAFWSPTWVERPGRAPADAPVGPWLLVGSPDDDLVGELVRALVARGHHAEVATTRAHLESTDARSIVLVGPTPDATAAAERWLAEGSLAAQVLGAADDGPTLLAAVTRGATDADGPATAPADAMAAGIIRTAPREYQGLRTTHLDLAPARAGITDLADDAATVLQELFEGDDLVVARRGGRRLVPLPEREEIAAPPTGASFRAGGRYLVTGGLGGVGFAVASRLASLHGAELAIIASRPVPVGAERDRWLAHHAPDDPTSRRIRRLAQLEALGGRVVALTADIADPASVAHVLDLAEDALGPLDGVVHAAGEVRDRPIELATEEDHEVVLGAKARGALALVDELGRRGTDLLVLVSSTSTVLAPEGQAAYVAANSVLDALAGDHGALRVRTVDFGLWSETGTASARRYGLGIEPGSAVAHPVLSTSSTERDGTLSLVGSLDARHQWVVDEHRTTDGIAILPGTGHVELFLAAAALSGIDGAVDEVALVAPLVVPDDTGVVVRVQVSPPDEHDRRGLRLESDAGTGTWHLHSEAHLVPTRAVPAEATGGEPVRSAGAIDVDVFTGPAARMHFGPRWHTVVEAWRDGDEVVGRLALADPLDLDVDAWLAHPALVDVATMFGMALGDHPDHLYVPTAYGRVTRTGPLPSDPWVRARRSGPPSADVLRIDVSLGSGASTLLTVEGLALRPVAGSAVLGLGTVAEEEPAEHAHRIPPLLAVAGPYGIVADEGVEMLERLVASGHPRLIASSIELDDLLALVDTPTPVAVHQEHAAAHSGGATSVLSTIRDIWVELLGVADVGDDDDFFDLGGHSLIAIRLMARIHKQLGVRFQLATIFDAPTVAALAEEVRAQRPELDDELAAGTAPTAPEVGAATTAAPPHRSLVTITTEGGGRPLFVVHGAGGNVLFLWTLARAMAGTRPLYGFQARGVDGGDMPDPTVEAMAERYVTELRAAHEGPFLLGGYSGGGIVAFEMVRQLQALGEQVDQLVLFDSPVPGEEALSAGQQLYWFAKNVRRSGVGAMKPYARWRAKELAHLYLPFLGKRGRDVEIANAARQIGAVDVENLGFVDLYYYFSAAAGRYSMPRLEVDAVLVKADRIWPVHPHDYHWSRFILGRIDVISTPGDHWSMFYAEHAPRLAEALMPALRHLDP